MLPSQEHLGTQGNSIDMSEEKSAAPRARNWELYGERFRESCGDTEEARSEQFTQYIPTHPLTTSLPSHRSGDTIRENRKVSIHQNLG